MDVNKLSALADRVLDGETQAYEAIYLETKDDIFFHAKTILESEEAAWDAVQDSYIAAFRSLEKLKSSGDLSVWLRAIASNICFTRLRKQPRGRTDAPPESGGTFSGKTLAALPDMQRTAVLLRYCDDMSLSQIASVMRCSGDTAAGSLAAAEKALGLTRDLPLPQGKITPAELRADMERLRLRCQLTPALTLSIGSVIAQKCGYTSALRVTSGVDMHSSVPRASERSRQQGQPQKRNAQEPAGKVRDSREVQRGGSNTAKWEKPSQGGKLIVVLAVALIIAGIAFGIYAVRGILSRSGGSEVTYSDAAHGAQSDISGPSVTSESAQAYLGVLTGYTGKVGVCTSAVSGPGLAYARLTDFDGDGSDELYLYYIDRDFSQENRQYSIGSDGNELWCLHEELWKYDGELKKCFAQEHFHTGSVNAANSTGRWIYSDGDIQRLASWHSDIDVNGYVNQYLDIYELDGGELKVGCEVSATFVVANQARHMADGYQIEQYYGTDNASFDDIAYFFEGAVKNADGRESCTYRDCQALADLPTSDIVPLDDYSADNPLTILKNFYDARRDSGTQLISFNGNSLTWKLVDINALLSDLADICTGAA